MAGETEVLENQVSAEDIAEAKGLGWADKDQWRGDPEKWVDASTFLTNGRHALTVMSGKNKTLEANAIAQAEATRQLQEKVRAQDAALAAIEQDRIEEGREELAADKLRIKAELADANRNGEHERVAELTDQLTETNLKLKEPVKKVEPTTTTTSKAADPEVIKWYQENSDFVANPRKLSLAGIIAQELRNGGEKRTGRIFMDIVAAAVEKEMGGGARGNSKVADAGDGTTGEQSSGGKKAYVDLPQSAKDACARMEKRVVGDGKKFSTLAAWQKAYAIEYYKQEQK